MTRHSTSIRPIAVVLPVLALALGSGCIVESSPNRGGANIYWTFQSTLAGDIGAFADSATVVCGLAGVDHLEITFTDPAGDVLAPSTVWCAPTSDVLGVAYLDMEPGTWGYDIAGLRSGVAVFGSSGTFVVRDGADTNVDVRLGALYHDARVDYTVADLTGCDGIELTLGLGSTTVFTTLPTARNPGLDLACAASGSRVFPSLTPGVYEMGAMVEYGAAGRTAGDVIAYSACNPTWTQLSTGDKTFSVAIDAAAAGVACAR